MPFAIWFYSFVPFENSFVWNKNYRVLVPANEALYEPLPVTPLVKSVSVHEEPVVILIHETGIANVQ
jgi:hypothetical protein